MPCEGFVPTVRRAAAPPFRFDAHAAVTGKVCHPGRPRWKAVTVVRRSLAVVDRVTLTGRLRLRLWWPGRSRCFIPANREHRCESGTAPPLCSGDSSSRAIGKGSRAVAFEPLPPTGPARAAEARRRAAAGVRESEDLPGVRSLPDREAGWRARPHGRPVAFAPRIRFCTHPLPGALCAGFCAAERSGRVWPQTVFVWNVLVAVAVA